MEDIFINPLRINKLLDNNYYKVQGYTLQCSNKYKPKGKLSRKSKPGVQFFSGTQKCLVDGVQLRRSFKGKCNLGREETNASLCEPTTHWKRLGTTG